MSTLWFSSQFLQYSNIWMHVEQVKIGLIGESQRQRQTKRLRHIFLSFLYVYFLTLFFLQYSIYECLWSKWKEWVLETKTHNHWADIFLSYFFMSTLWFYSQFLQYSNIWMHVKQVQRGLICKSLRQRQTNHCWAD